ncbi:hypothetical protein GmHk_10G028281 [Glycine max]|nr:hypothetical protein GmHk_10G028281 [Glycine max]
MPLCEAWELVNNLLRQCPTHGLDDGARRKIMCKTPSKAKKIIENMASNDYKVHQDRTLVHAQRRAVPELNCHDAVLTQNKLLT